MFVEEPRTPEALEAIALVNYIDDLGRQLSANNIESIVDDSIPRSPSPPPEYDKQGKRTNTREQRLRNTLSIERTLAVRKALELIPDYVPPSDFSRLTRIVEKYPIPVRDFPQINFVGLLLGPRGNALRRMEADSGARISIRGRGSVKEGARSATAQQGQEEDLHCLVSATSHESIEKAFSLIKHVIDTATQTPEHQNDFKRLQLRELAELNGTLRDYENQLCTYCGEPGHRKFACAQREAALKETVCRTCGQQGHIMRDCSQSGSSQPAGLQQFLDDLDDEPVAPEPQVVRPRPSRQYTELSGNNNDSGNDMSTNMDAALSQDDAILTNMPDSRSSVLSRQVPAPPGVNTQDVNIVAAPPGVEPRHFTNAPPGRSPPGIVPAVVSPPGISPPGLAPGAAPPGVVPPGVPPPGVAPLGVASPGIAPPGVAPPGTGASSVQVLKKNMPPPPSAWKPPTTPQ